MSLPKIKQYIYQLEFLGTLLRNAKEVSLVLYQKRKQAYLQLTMVGRGFAKDLYQDIVENFV